MQGSSLGPILFLCFINDFPSSTILKVYMFADDTTCLMAGTNIEELINLVNVEVQKMANWYRANRLAVNTSKSKYIIFHCKGKKINFIPQIFYNSNEIVYYIHVKCITMTVHDGDDDSDDDDDGDCGDVDDDDCHNESVYGSM